MAGYVTRKKRIEDEPLRPRVGFLFIGGEHQMLHVAPVAVELARSNDCEIELFVGSACDYRQLAQIVRDLGGNCAIAILPTPPWLRFLRPLSPRRLASKSVRLLAARHVLRDLDVIVTAERTSVILKRVPGWRPRLIHIPHGAGDRAQGFEDRLRLLDHVIVAGHKDRDRMIREGLVVPRRCSVSGYIKRSAVLRMKRCRSSNRTLFNNEKPTVLYNPHFSPGLSSWSAFGAAFARAVATMHDYNFIIAPHVRLAARLSSGEREGIEALAQPGRVLVDLGSERSSDMTYTMAADIYVGDVSSQVYEFLCVPKPCLFLNATGSDRRHDESFACWRFGEVVDEPDEILRGIGRARARHADFIATQISGVSYACGSDKENAARNAAAIVRRLAFAAGVERPLSTQSGLAANRRPRTSTAATPSTKTSASLRP